jgi:5-methylcytosine-specific restriction endonuclease McrA
MIERNDKGQFVKGKSTGYQFKEGHISVNKGRKRTEEYKKKMSESCKKVKRHWLTGVKKSEETKEKIRQSNLGQKRSEETKKKLSDYRKQMVGIKSSNWQGGKSFEPYTVDWTKTLKRSIRERDKYTCQICGIEPSCYVHHIDYDKPNCNPDNLITLCVSCHSKTNGKREEWIKYFKDKNERE